MAQDYNSRPVTCENKCSCSEEMHSTRLIVITGGPGAGKTAVLEMAKKVLCEHIAILPEAASIVFGGGFWRIDSQSGRIAAQRAIYHIQTELESLVVGEKKWAAALCDRGTLDGFAYWPTEPEIFWKDVNTTYEKELNRYAAVIHLKTPSEKQGYNHQNPLRIESSKQALEIDQKIQKIWSMHSNYIAIESKDDFLEKAQRAMREIASHLPECCRPLLELKKS